MGFLAGQVAGRTPRWQWEGGLWNERQTDRKGLLVLGWDQGVSVLSGCSLSGTLGGEEGDVFTGRGWEVAAMCLWFSYNSVLRSPELPNPGVCILHGRECPGRPVARVGGFRLGVWKTRGQGRPC